MPAVIRLHPEGIYDFLNRIFDFVDLGGKFLNEFNGMLQFQRFSRVEEIARMLAISLRSAYNLCNSTTEFRVLRVGGSIRVPKDSFDAWLYRAA